jgi:hypothetical protein
MGRAFNYQDRELWVFKTAEADAVYHAARVLNDGLESPDGCADLLEALQTAAAEYSPTLNNIVDQFDPTFDAFSVVSLSDLQTALGIDSAVAEPIPERTDDARLFNLWNFDPVLRSIAAYAPQGVVVPLAWRQPLEELSAGVTSIESGRCAWRTQWGLVGAVAVMGAVILAGGAYVVSRAKKRK